MGKGESMIEGVIFDMDGLMFDTEPLWTVAYDEVLPKFGIPEVPPDMPDAPPMAALPFPSPGASASRLPMCFPSLSA